MNITQRGLASMERINRVMEEKPDIVDMPEHRIKRLPQLEHGYEIRFKNVSFSYNGGSGRELVLKNLNFTIRRGETVSIVGPTGSGKSTLVSLILRLIDPVEGTVEIEGTPVREIPLEDLRSKIGLVPQDIFLFSDTVRENIAFGVTSLDEEEMRSAGRIASIEEEMEEFPRKFDSPIGERGINLSGGQKQRVAIARALVRNPQILVLDDSLSSVDADTEEKILLSLRSVMVSRTSLLISHRISTVRLADRIFVLDGGELAEVGSHEELIERGGLYAEMYRKQLIVSELEGR
jgi:ATP-binding cassette subfamily B protein